MRNKFLAYAVIVTLLSSLASWGSMTRHAMGGAGSSGAWYGGGSGGGWASASGGGHK